MTARMHSLANGVRVICDPIAGLETFALTVMARGGARHEPAARWGWSHLLEHMVFKGAAGRSAETLAETIEAAGAQINAYTGQERTSFQVRALKDRLSFAVEIVSDLLFRPAMTEEELEREKIVVGHEIAEAFDTPDDHVFELAQARTFADQALGRPILGATESLAPADPSSLHAWRRAIYAPERLVVAAAGAVDESALLAAAERWFGAEPKGSEDLEAEPARFVGGADFVNRSIEQANLVFHFPSSGALDEDWYAARIGAELLGGGMASRLFQEAREKRGLAYSIDAWLESFDDTGLVGVFAGSAPDKAEALATLTAAEILKLAEGVDPRELGRAKAQAEAAIFMAEESPPGRAERAAAQTLLYGRPLDTQEVRRGVEAVSRDAVTAALRRGLDTGRATAAVLGPRGAQKAADAFLRTMAAG